MHNFCEKIFRCGFLPCHQINPKNVLRICASSALKKYSKHRGRPFSFIAFSEKEKKIILPNFVLFRTMPIRHPAAMCST